MTQEEIGIQMGCEDYLVVQMVSIGLEAYSTDVRLIVD